MNKKNTKPVKVQKSDVSLSGACTNCRVDLDGKVYIVLGEGFYVRLCATCLTSLVSEVCSLAFGGENNTVKV